MCSATYTSHTSCHFTYGTSIENHLKITLNKKTEKQKRNTNQTGYNVTIKDLPNRLFGILADWYHVKFSVCHHNIAMIDYHFSKNNGLTDLNLH